MKIRNFVALVLAVVFITGCAGTGQKCITQISPIDALLAGSYDGTVTCRKLLGYGDLGIGTFDRLDGEMAVIDGVVYQIKSDGKVSNPPLSLTTPFAAIVDFNADGAVGVDKVMTMADLTRELDRVCSDSNRFYAISAKGSFKSMKTRSVPAQVKPYPPLVQVTAHQPVFEATNISGRVVGFRCPPFVKGINVPGYHLHFVSDDRSLGGHILDFAMSGGEATFMKCNQLLLVLPEASDAAGFDLTKDRSADLESAEKDPAGKK